MIKYKVLKANRQSIIVPELSKFCLKYEKGAIVKCVKGSIGIMVFSSHYYARDFKNAVVSNGIIVKVRPIGRARPIPPKIAAFSIHEPDVATSSINQLNMLLSTIKYYSNVKKVSAIYKAQCWVNEVPEGTRLYNAVEVLE